MSADEFWNGPPRLAGAYAEAYKLKMRHENDVAWLSGAYMFDAVQVALANGFGKKGAKKAKYPTEPFNLGLETEVEKEQKARREREKIIASLTAWKKAWDAQHKDGE